MIAGAAIASAAAVIGVQAVKAVAEFEKGMANVATLLDGDVKTRINELNRSVKDLMTQTGLSAETLQEGLYQTISALGDTTDSMYILEIASKGAVAGNASVTDSVNLLSAVMKGYGVVSKESAQKVSDLAFLTVKLGQTTFPELASSMGKVIPLADTLKLSQEELFGAMATLTGVTGQAGEVTTQLRGILTDLMDPSTEMTEQLNLMGYETGVAAMESLGLNGTLMGLKESVQGNETEFANLFGRIEGTVAALALSGSQADIFTTKTLAMTDAVGSTEKAFKTQQNTLSSTMARLKESFNVVKVEIGEQLLPHVQKVADWIMSNMPKIKETITNVFQKIASAIKVVVTLVKDKFPIMKQFFKDAFETAVKVITPVITAIKTATKFIKEHWKVIEPILAGIAAGALAFKIITGAIAAYNIIVGIATAASGAFSAAIAFISGPIGIIIIAIGALVAAGIFLYKNWDEVSAFLVQAWEDIKDFAVGLWGSLKDIFMNKIPYAIGFMIGYVLESIPKVIESITTFFEELPAKAGEWLGKTISKIINMLPEATAAAKGFGKGILEGIMGFITSIPAKIGATVDKIKGFFGNIFGKASEGATAGIEAARIPGAAQGGIVETAGSVWVGEQGAELLTLPKAASITPLPTGKNINMTINNPKFFSQRDMDKMMDNAVRRINLKVG